MKFDQETEDYLKASKETFEARKKAGGQRSGAGRKPAGENKKIKIAFKLDENVVAIIRDQPNQAAFLEEIVRQWQKANFS